MAWLLVLLAGGGGVGAVRYVVLRRQALACVQARVVGLPLPELRPPCCFNPQHGPSARDGLWTSGRHGTCSVPACAQDAARVAARDKPQVRMAEIGSRRVPYWEAGAAFLPSSQGYFPAGTYAAAALEVRPGTAICGAGHFGRDFGGGGGDGGGGGAF